MTDPIQSLWIGAALSPMERLCIESFQAQGHDFHLYVYERVANVPHGTIVLDAAGILPAERIFRYRDSGSVAGFSNYFRYKLLMERGGWWVDTDFVCLAPFDFPTPHVFASELARGTETVTSCAIRAPKGSPAMEHAWRTCDARDPATLSWGETGPRLVGDVVRRFQLERSVQPPPVFCPVPFYEWRTLIERDLTFGPTTRAVHLWNEMWRREGTSKEPGDHGGSFYGRVAEELRATA